MRRHIAEFARAVAFGRKHLAVADEHRADRRLVAPARGFGLPQRQIHEASRARRHLASLVPLC